MSHNAENDAAECAHNESADDCALRCDPCWHEECRLAHGHEGLHESYMAPRVTPPAVTDGDGAA